MDFGDRLILVLFAVGLLYLVFLFFKPLFVTTKDADTEGKSNIIIVEPEESEEERQFREYGDCYGFSYYGDDEK